MVSESRPVLLLLSAAVIVVLLVACANVANLLLARGTGRLREFALRAAIGADRGRLVRQMLTESAALSMLGAAGGMLLAYWATRALTGLAATGIPRADQIGLNVTVLGFAVAAAMLTSVVFGLLPALHLSKHDFNDALKEGGRSQGAALGRGARELLIVAEVAMSIVLLIGAGLLIRSLWQLQQVNPGFSADKVLAMEVSLPTARYEEGEQMPFYQRLEERIAAKPGWPRLAPSISCRSAPTTTAAACRSRIIPGLKGRATLRRRDRRRRDTSRRWAFRCWPDATSMRTTSRAGSSR